MTKQKQIALKNEAVSIVNAYAKLHTRQVPRNELLDLQTKTNLFLLGNPELKKGKIIAALKTIRDEIETVLKNKDDAFEVEVSNPQKYLDIAAGTDKGLAGFSFFPIICGAIAGEITRQSVSAAMWPTFSKKQAVSIGIIDETGLGFVHKKSVFKKINAQLIEKMNSGNLVWRKPWRDGYKVKGVTYGPQNYVTQNPYTGANAFLVNIHNVLSGTNYKYFLTRKQIKDRGGKLNNDAEPFPVFAFIRGEEIKKNKKTGEEEILQRHGIVDYIVYPIEHTTGVKEIKRKKKAAKEEPDFHIAAPETIIEKMPKKPAIHHGGSRAYYLPAADNIQMPVKKSFHKAPEYYSTLFHELVHSTGNKKRIGRNMEGKKGSKEYAFEELIAELGASYLCGFSGIDYYTLENSAAYLKSWSRKLKDEMQKDDSFFFRAIYGAVKAAKYILANTIVKHGKPVVEPSTTKKKPSATKKKSSKKLSKKDIFYRDMPKQAAKELAEYWGNKKIMWNKKELAFTKKESDELTEVQHYINKYHPEFNKFLDRRASDNISDLSDKAIEYFEKHQKYIDKFAKKGSLDMREVGFIRDAIAPGASTVSIYGMMRKFIKAHDEKVPTVKKNKSIKASVNAAIEDLLKLDKYKRASSMAMSMMYSAFKDNEKVDYSDFTGLKEKMFEKMRDDSWIFDDDDERYVYVLEPKGREIIEAINGRLQTLRAKKAGTDLFPDLAGIGIIKPESVPNEPKTVLKTEKTVQKERVKNIDEIRNMKFDLVTISPEFIKLIGEFCLPIKILVFGPGGSGKSSLTLLLSQDFAIHNYPVYYIAGEQYGTPTFSKMLNQLDIQNSPNLTVYKDFSRLTDKHKIIVLDSKDSLEIDVKDFVELQKKYPNKSWIVLSQGVTTKKGFSGNEAWRNEMDTLIYCADMVAKTGDHKNRWGGKSELSIKKKIKP